MLIRLRESPNQSNRLHGDDSVRLIVVHTPEGAYESTVNWCLNPRSKVSYHLLIKKDGTEATQLVPYHKKAWHAGPMNSISDGISIEGHARTFDLSDRGVREAARLIAVRLISRGLPCQWTTDPAKGGFCRHGDLQSDRTDPTPDLAEWRLFVSMVKAEYDKLGQAPKMPRPIPAWFWIWARWWLGVSEFKKYGPRKGPRPKSAPRLIPPWAWLRLRQLAHGHKA